MFGKASGKTVKWKRINDLEISGGEIDETNL